MLDGTIADLGGFLSIGTRTGLPSTIPHGSPLTSTGENMKNTSLICQTGSAKETSVRLLRLVTNQLKVQSRCFG